MNRNVEAHFAELPKIDIERSVFDRSSGHKTSMNVGDLVPIYIDEVIPGDIFNVTTSAVVRLQTLLTPIYDNLYLDTYFFFVPNRLVWSHWKEFMGENTGSAWIPSTSYRVPRLVPPSGGWNVGTIADYFGIPTGVDLGLGWSDLGNAPNALPFRAYAMICNEWFRDQNVSDPLSWSVGDSDVTGSNGTNYITDVAKGGAPFKAAKYHDYFTSMLPSPQKGPNIGLWANDLAGSFSSLIPVYPTGKISNPYVSGSQRYPLHVAINTGSETTQKENYRISERFYATNFEDPTQGITAFKNANTGPETSIATMSAGYTTTNLWANVGAMNLSINELRLAFQLQKFYEKNARAGSRYREVLKEHFGVTSSDARMQIPEYLGGHRFPLSIHQVANQSQGANDFLGDLGAMSMTSDVHEDFIKSFEEHGFVIGVAVVRYDHSYPQGLEPFWSRVKSTDYYWPVFANIGEQPVYGRSLYWSSSEQNNTTVIGYQEYAADYRYKPNRVSSEMRPGVTNSLATWHLADNYASMPTPMSDAWIREDKSNVDRVLAVTSAVSNQVFCDFYFKNICTRPMPMYSIPGLIDHH